MQVTGPHGAMTPVLKLWKDPDSAPSKLLLANADKKLEIAMATCHLHVYWLIVGQVAMLVAEASQILWTCTAVEKQILTCQICQ